MLKSNDIGLPVPCEAFRWQDRSLSTVWTGRALCPVHTIPADDCEYCYREERDVFRQIRVDARFGMDKRAEMV